MPALLMASIDVLRADSIWANDASWVFSDASSNCDCISFGRLWNHGRLQANICASGTEDTAVIDSRMSMKPKV